MTTVIDLSTPEKVAEFERVYMKALRGHMADPSKPLDLVAVADEVADSHKATPEEVHAQRVEGATGGDPDPS